MMDLLNVDLNSVRNGKVKRSDKIEPLLGLNYRGVLDAATNVPVVGDALSGGLAAYDLSQGDYGSAALNALGVLPFVSGTLVNHGKLFRGLVNKPDAAIKKPIEWYSETEDLARKYGSNVIAKPKSTADVTDLGFRDYMTEVKQDDVFDRVKRSVVDNFKAGKIDKKKAIELNDRIEDLRSGSGQFKRAHEFINTPEVAAILKDSGYDAISHLENGHQTYGFLNAAVNTPKLTEFEQRHLIAQRNASLPVEQGGLGLPPNNTAMDRARAMNMVDAYHATTADIPQFDISKSSSAAAFGKGVYTADDPLKVSGWAKSTDGANVMPLMVDKSKVLPMEELNQSNASKLSSFFERDIQEGAAVPYFSLEKRGGSVSEGAGLAGFSGVDHAGPGGLGLNTVFIDPSAIRSRFAAFDPMRRHEADLLGYADPRLLGAIAGGGLLGLGGYSLLDQ